MAIIQAQIRWADNTAELKQHILDGVSAVDAMKSSVDRTVASLSGNGLFQAANKVSAAIITLGDTTKLTASEQERANALLDKAIDKYQAMGMVVPPAMQAIADALKPPLDSLDKLGTAATTTGDSFSTWSGKFDIEHAISDPLGTAKAGLGAFAETLGPVGIALSGVAAAAGAVGAAIYELANRAADTGEGVLNFSRIAGTSVEVASQLGNTAIIAGGSLDQMTTIITQLQRRLDQTGPSADKMDIALADLNINAAAFRAADPTDRVYMMAAAMQAAEGSTNMVSDALAVMGRGAISNLPVLMKMTQDVQDVARSTGYVFTSETAKGAEDLKIEAGKLTLAWDALKTSMGVHLEPPVTAALEATNVLISNTQKEYDLMLKMSGVQIFHPNGPSVVSGPGAPGAVTPVADIPGLVPGLSQGDIDVANATYSMKMFDQAIVDAKADADAAATATQAYWAALGKVGQKIADLTAGYNDLTPVQQDAIVSFNTLGLGAGDIATQLGVSTTAVQAFETAWKALGTQLRAIQGQADAFITMPLPQALLTIGEAVPLKAFDTLAAAMGLLPATVTKIDGEFSGLTTTWNTGAGSLHTFVGGMALLPGVAASGKVGLDDLTTSTKAWDTEVRSVETILKEVGTTIGGTFGSAVSASAPVLGAFGTAQKAIVDFGSASAAAALSTTAFIVTAAIAIYNFSEALQAASDAAAALASNTQFAKDLATQFHSTSLFTDQLAKSITTFTANASDFQFSGQTVATKINDIVKELGGWAHLTVAQLKAVQDQIDSVSKTVTVGDSTITGNSSLFGLIKQGGVIGATATTALDTALVGMGQASIAAGGLVDQFFLDTVKHAQDAGITLPGVTAIILAQAQAAGTGLNSVMTGLQGSSTAYLQAMATATGPVISALHPGLETLDEMKTRIAALVGPIHVTQTEFNGLSAATVADFATMMKQGMSFKDALAAIQPSMLALQKAMTDSGVTGGSAFALLSNMSTIANDAIKGPLATAIQGVNTALQGLHNSGILNQDMFTGLGDTAVDSYHKIIANGGDATAALGIMQPTLQTMWELEKNFGMKADDATQALIDQAVAAGQVGEKYKTPADQMLDATNHIADAIDKLVTLFTTTLPAAAGTAADAITKKLGGITVPTVHVPVVVDAQTGGGNPQDPSQQLASGGIVQYRAAGGNILPFPGTPRGTDTVAAWLTPGERVLSVAQNQTYSQFGAFGAGGDTRTHAGLEALRADLRDAMQAQEERAATQMILLQRTLPRQIRAAIQLAGAA